MNLWKLNKKLLVFNQ